MQSPQYEVVNVKRKNRTNPRANRVLALSMDNRQQLMGSASADTWQSMVILQEENTTISKEPNKRHHQSIPVQCFGVLRDRGPTRSCIRPPQHGEKGFNQHLHLNILAGGHEEGTEPWMLQPVLDLAENRTCSRLLICP